MALDRDRDEVDLGLDPLPGHADRIGVARLAVDPVVLRNRVQQFLVLAERDGAGDVVHPGEIDRADLAAGNARHAVRDPLGDVHARHAAVHRADFEAGHLLRASSSRA